MKKRILVLIMAVATVVALTGCTTYSNFKESFFGEKDGEKIKIAVYEPLTGADAAKGEEEVRGIKIAHKLFPTVLGKEIDLIYADSGSNLDVAETSVQDLIPKVPAVVLGSYGSVYSLLGGEYFHNAQLPAIAITNTNPYVTKDNPYYFRVCSVESYQADAMAYFVSNQLQTSQVAMLSMADDDVGITLGNAFGEAMIKYAQTENPIAITREYKNTDTDCTGYLKEIESSGATVVYMPNESKAAAKIIEQAEKGGMDLTFIGPGQWDNNTFIKETSKATMEIYFPSISIQNVGNEELYNQFKEAYQEEYGQYAKISDATALAFDSYIVAIRGIEAAGTYIDGPKIAEAMRSLRTQGLTGVISFDGVGDSQREIIINRTTKGKSLPVYTVGAQQ